MYNLFSIKNLKINSKTSTRYKRSPGYFNQQDQVSITLIRMQTTHTATGRSAINVPAVALDFYDAIITNGLDRVKRAVESNRVDLNAFFVQVRKKQHLYMCPIHLVSFKGIHIKIYFTNSLENFINIIICWQLLRQCFNFENSKLQAFLII